MPRPKKTVDTTAAAPAAAPATGAVTKAKRVKKAPKAVTGEPPKPRTYPPRGKDGRWMKGTASASAPATGSALQSYMNDMMKH